MATFLTEKYFDGTTYLKLQIFYDLAQNQANNTSTITYYLYASSANGGYGSGSATTGYVNGEQVGQIYSVPQNQQVLIGSKSVTVTHNNDGTGSATYSAQITCPWGSARGTSVSGTLALPRINRASTWGVGSYTLANIENSFNLSINKYVTSYTNKVTVTNLQMTTTVRTINNAVNGQTITFTSSELNTIYSLDNNPNTNDLRLYMNLYTYDGNGNQVGEVQRIQIYAGLTNANPTASYTFVEQNAKVVSLLGGSQTNNVVKFASTLLATINASPKKGAKITSVTINNNNITGSNNVYTATLSNIQTGTFSVVLTDSRGNKGTYTITKTLLNYIQLGIRSNYIIKRASQVSSNITLTATVDYFNSTISGTANTFLAEYKVNSGSWVTIPSSKYSISGNTVTFNNADLGSLIATNTSGTIYIRVTDKLMTSQQYSQISKAVATFSLGETDAQVNGTLYVADASGNNKVDISPTYVASETRIGTWKDGRPLYRRILEIGHIASNTATNIAFNVPNMHQIKHIYGYSISVYNTTLDLNYNVNGNAGHTYYNSGYINFKSYYETLSGEIVVEYTKTS